MQPIDGYSRTLQIDIEPVMRKGWDSNSEVSMIFPPMLNRLPTKDLERKENTGEKKPTTAAS